MKHKTSKIEYIKYIKRLNVKVVNQLMECYIVIMSLRRPKLNFMGALRYRITESFVRYFTILCQILAYFNCTSYDNINVLYKPVDHNILL